MQQESPKEFLIRLYLELLLSFIPPQDAVVATLGGKGLEAKVWLELGIREGWLVERKRALSRALIQSLPFHHCSNLEALPSVMEAVFGARAPYIDFLHLDLCGVLETKESIRIYGPLLPLVLASRARCLAVTVADQRRNLTLEHFDAVLTRANDLLGSDFVQHVLAHLHAEQELVADQGFGAPDTRKAALREFGTLFRLAELFIQSGATVPFEVQRFVYQSSNGRNAHTFRMRSYHIQFSAPDAPAADQRHFARRVVKAWLSGSLQVVQSGGVQRVLTPPSTHKEIIIMSSMKLTLEERFPNATRVLPSILQSDFGTEVAELLSIADKEAKETVGTATVLDAFERLAQQFRAGEVVQKPTEQPVLWDDETDLGLKLRLLRASQSGDSELFEAAKRRVIAVKKWQKDKRAGRRVGGMLARTQGKFRAGYLAALFVAVDEAQHERLLAELLGLYDESLDTLRAEAGI